MLIEVKIVLAFPKCLGLISVAIWSCYQAKQKMFLLRVVQFYPNRHTITCANSKCLNLRSSTSFTVQTCVRARDVEAVIFQTLPLPHLSLPLPPLPLPPTKNEKMIVDNFLNFCGSVACLLLHFIILRKQKPSFIVITLPTLLELIVLNYSVFVFLRYQNSC